MKGGSREDTKVRHGTSSLSTDGWHTNVCMIPSVQYTDLSRPALRVNTSFSVNDYLSGVLAKDPTHSPLVLPIRKRNEQTQQKSLYASRTVWLKYSHISCTPLPMALRWRREQYFELFMRQELMSWRDDWSKALVLLLNERGRLPVQRNSRICNGTGRHLERSLLYRFPGSRGSKGLMQRV